MASKSAAGYDGFMPRLVAQLLYVNLHSLYDESAYESTVTEASATCCQGSGFAVLRAFGLWLSDLRMDELATNYVA